MLGLGKKDEDGKQVRVEHRGKYTRASRTGGVSVRAEQKLEALTVTGNTSRGVRASIRVSNGVRVAFQNSRLQFIGRWRAGPFGLNVSKTGVSGSIKNRAGSFNFVKPQYSSFKIAGVQVRGKKAANLQLIYMLITGLLFLAAMMFHLAVSVLWVLVLIVLFVCDVITGFVRGVRFV